MLTGILVVIALAAAGYWYWISTRPESAGQATQTDGTSTQGQVSTSAGMLAEDNAVVVNEQRPGNSVTGSLVYLDASGFLVLHEAGDGEPGAIIGSSALLSRGENSNIRVSLSRQTRDGETLYAMLHYDTNGDGRFDANTDTPVPSQLGGPIYGWFDISSSASENVPVSI